MSVELTMRRLSEDTYARAVAEGQPQPEYLAVNRAVYKRWDVLHRILDSGGPGAAGAAVIVGGLRLPHGGDDYGGVRVLSPAEVVRAASDLRALTGQEIERRYAEVDFTGAYGADDSRPASPAETYVRAFEELRDFCAQAAEAGNALMVWLG